MAEASGPIPSRFEPPRRRLLAPGPSAVHPRVLEAMARPVIGHLDPETLRMLDEIQGMLREVFRTENELTFPVSGTGTAGMECALANVLERGDVAIVMVSGAFAERMAEIARRTGADVVGQLVHRVLAVQQRPHDPQSRVIGEQLQQVGRGGELRVTGPGYLRGHADSVA